MEGGDNAGLPRLVSHTCHGQGRGITSWWIASTRSCGWTWGWRMSWVRAEGPRERCFYSSPPCSRSAAENSMKVCLCFVDWMKWIEENLIDHEEISPFLTDPFYLALLFRYLEEELDFPEVHPYFGNWKKLIDQMVKSRYCPFVLLLLILICCHIVWLVFRYLHREKATGESHTQSDLLVLYNYQLGERAHTEFSLDVVRRFLADVRWFEIVPIFSCLFLANFSVFNPSLFHSLSCRI